ncbi:MAG: ATP-binding protein [Thermoleophilia bacterium]|nr:ATP-binding protein [Thermoleophilia bacterium]
MAESYLPRVVDRELDELIRGLPAIAIEGAKGVGKTVTAKRRAGTVWELDDPIQRELIDADVRRIRQGETPVLIDEWQRLPETWDLVRRAVDSGSRPGSFLLTGSSSGVKTGTHSGAGRILPIRMRPLSLAERVGNPDRVSLSSLLAGENRVINGRSRFEPTDYIDELFKSGFPGLRALPANLRKRQMSGYIDRIIDQDFPELGPQPRNPAGLRRWMRAYAAAVSTTASWEKIRDAATPGQNDPPARSTVLPYRDVLERLWILDELPAWDFTGSELGRVGRSPKHHLADPALVVSLLKINQVALTGGDQLDSSRDPAERTSLGRLFESLATLSVRVYAQQAEAEVHHFRNQNGTREIDLIVTSDSGRTLALEVKLGAKVGDNDVTHLNWLADRLGSDRVERVILTTGPEAYRRKDGVAVIPLELFGP